MTLLRWQRKLLHHELCSAVMIGKLAMRKLISNETKKRFANVGVQGRFRRLAYCSMVKINAPRHAWTYDLSNLFRYPNLVTHVFSICTPYSAPSEKYFSTEDLVKGPIPQFAYQLHLA